jgi:hypothetical protein
MIKALLAVVWTPLRCVLPYPDLLRRLRVRRKAFRLISCEPWPGDDAAGSDAAQLALLRLLWLQQRVHRATRLRARDEAALMARASLETCIVGLYCLHSGEAVTRLTAGERKAARRVVSFLTAQELVSQEAIDSALKMLGGDGPGLPDLRALGQWLEKENIHAGELYDPYYVPLSHFYAHASAFTLLRHVRPDGKLTRKPTSPWARRSAARLADMCTGLLASAIADKAWKPDELYARYADGHLKRMLTPAFTVAARAWRQNLRMRDLPGVITNFVSLYRYARGPGLSDPPAEQEARVPEAFTRVFEPIAGDAPPEMFAKAIDEFVAMVVADMRARAGAAPGPPETDPEPS